MRAASCLRSSVGPDSGSARAMFSTTVKAGIRRRSWNTMPMPSSRPTAGEVICTGTPSTTISPSSGW